VRTVTPWIPECASRCDGDVGGLNSGGTAGQRGFSGAEDAGMRLRRGGPGRLAEKFETQPKETLRRWGARGRGKGEILKALGEGIIVDLGKRGRSIQKW